MSTILDASSCTLNTCSSISCCAFTAYEGQQKSAQPTSALFFRCSFEKSVVFSSSGSSASRRITPQRDVSFSWVGARPKVPNPRFSRFVTLWLALRSRSNILGDGIPSLWRRISHSPWCVALFLDVQEDPHCTCRSRGPRELPRFGADSQFPRLLLTYSDYLHHGSRIRTDSTAGQRCPCHVRIVSAHSPSSYYIHYDDIDLKKWVFSGTVDVDLEVKKETSFIMLNAKELSIAVRCFVSSAHVVSPPLSRLEA